MITEQRLHKHFMDLASAIGGVRATEEDGKPINIPKAYEKIISRMRHAHAQGNKVMFIGNGGSAAIASHMAIDYAKNGGIRSVAFNDASALTCTANDYGYEQGFSRLLDIYADPGDVVVAISSSGESANILNAVRSQVACVIYTLSGFDEGNSLRKLGDINLYVPTAKGQYGFTEITHLSILHAILDMICEDNHAKS